MQRIASAPLPLPPYFNLDAYTCLCSETGCYTAGVVWQQWGNFYEGVGVFSRSDAPVPIRAPGGTFISTHRWSGTARCHTGGLRGKAQNIQGNVSLLMHHYQKVRRHRRVSSMLLPFYYYPKIETKELVVSNEYDRPGLIRIRYCRQPRDARAITPRREKHRTYAAQSKRGGRGGGLNHRSRVDALYRPKALKDVSQR